MRAASAGSLPPERASVRARALRFAMLGEHACMARNASDARGRSVDWRTGLRGRVSDWGFVCKRLAGRAGCPPVTLRTHAFCSLGRAVGTQQLTL
jgi:hypothetical protein